MLDENRKMQTPKTSDKSNFNFVSQILHNKAFLYIKYKTIYK
jgi:hypothetical protein